MPAPYTNYPQAADLSTFLQATGLTAGSSGLTTSVPWAWLNLADRMSAGINQYEQLASRVMLAQTATYTFDPPGNACRKLALNADLAQLTSLTVQGQPLTLNTNFWLYPQNAGVMGKPYTWIEFLYPIAWVRQSIAITGLWGKYIALPAMTWDGMLAAAALDCYPQLAANLANGFVQLKEKDEMVSAGPEPLGYLKAAWTKTFERGWQADRRVESFAW